MAICKVVSKKSKQDKKTLCHKIAQTTKTTAAISGALLFAAAIMDGNETYQNMREFIFGKQEYHPPVIEIQAPRTQYVEAGYSVYYSDEYKQRAYKVQE